MNLDVVRSVVREAQEKEVSFLAASIAFYAFFSVIPVLMLFLAVASAVGGEALEGRILDFVGVYLSPEGEVVVDQALTSPAGRLGASIVSVAALSWSALKVFRAVDIAFDRIYEAEERATLGRRLVNGGVVLGAVGVGLLLMVVFRALAASLGVPYVGWLVLFGGLVAVFAPFYYIMPPFSVTVRDILPGTVVSVFGWLLLQGLFGVYASAAFRYQAYGFLGAVLLFLLWLYFGAMALLLGAVVNAVLD